MGAETSVQRDGKSQGEDASASASVSAGEGGSVLDTKPLQKNGQISSMTSLNGHSEDNTLAEVGQPDGVSVAQKEEAPETMDTIQDEVAPQVNGEKVEKESPDANDISAIEEKAADEKPDDASEVGFKKIFRFVGFKFTLKKDKSEEKDPVKLLTVKDKEEEEVGGTDEPTKEAEDATAKEKSADEEKEADTEAEVIKESDKAETTDAPAEGTATEATDEAVKEEGAEKKEETSPSQETTLSPFRKFFSGGLFSNLRKKASIKKTKEEEDKEAAVEETAKTEETAAAGEEKEEKDEAEQETKEASEEEKIEPKEEAPATPEEEKIEPKEEAPATPEEAKSETTAESDVTVETTDETKKEEEKAEPTAEEEKAPAEVTSEAELLSSQEKAKPQGSPLKKLFTGAGLKKLSTKKQKTKKDTETKPTESGGQAVEQLQSSTELAEAPKADSGPSSPEESGEHAIAVEVTQNESSQETEGEVASDGEKKKEGIIAWSSFKKLVTPKKRVKRSSESDDEATAEKPAKSATLSSSESAALADKSVEEEAKEEKPSEEEPKTENTEKLVSSTEEPKRKMDTSVSWEALMCMGGPKKRTRKTSDSDDEETKIEEEVPAAAEGEAKTEAAIVTSQTSEGEVVSSSEPLSSPPERESTWDTLKRMVMSKNKPKAEEKPEESGEQVQSDSEAAKDESSFSLKKFLPGRRKKKIDKQASTELGSGEEDSDTPAVVPLSEYEEQVEAVQEAPEEPAAVQIKVSTEDRSPSWIPAIVEPIDDKHDELSDIPEEAENAATPKSVDTDIAEDENEDEAALSLKALARRGRRLSTAEVKPVDQAPTAETTSVPRGPQPEKAEEVIGGLEAQISEIPAETSVTVEDVPMDVASEKVEYEPPTEKAEAKTNSILETHAPDAAMAICTGLGTKEIAKIALEKPAMPIIETMTVIRDAPCTEVAIEVKPLSTEEAIAAEDAVLKAQVHQVDTTELEPVVENSQRNGADIQAAAESYEPEIEKVGVVCYAQEQSEVLQATSMSENSPKVVVVNPITPTPETAVCTQSTEVTEPTVEIKEMEMCMEQDAATEENSPVKDIVQAICETTKVTMTKESESSIPLAVPVEKAPVITKTVVFVAPLSEESDHGTTEPIQLQETKSMEVVTMSKPVQVQESKVEGTVVETVEATIIQTAESEISAVIAQSSEKVEEIMEDCTVVETVETTIIQTAESEISAVIAQSSEKVEEIKEKGAVVQTLEATIIQTTESEISAVIDQTSKKVEEIKEECTVVETVEAAIIQTAESEISAVIDQASKKVEEMKEKGTVVETVEATIIHTAESEISAVIDQTSEKVEEIKEGGTVGETVEATIIHTAESEISAVIDQASKKVEEMKEDSEIEAQSMVIAQTVIQDAMDKVSGDAPEPEKPTTPAPVQAVATTEKEIVIATETPVITETPVAVTCEKPVLKAPKSLCVAMEVMDTIQVEVTESIDASEEEEKKPEESLKNAVEVNVSEETFAVEEAVEIKAENQTGEEPEQVKEEQSKKDTEVQEPEVKEAAGEAKPDSEEAKSEAPSEEDKAKVLEIHMPVQVVLQTAQVFEELSVEEEAVEEFDSNGPVAEDTSVKPESSTSENKLSTVSEEPQASEEATEAAASQPEAEKTSSVKCAEVMAQVIEVIEEAVKEIEPVSTEIIAAS